VPDKQTKAYDRIKNFRTELSDYRERFETLKHETEEKVSNDVLGTGFLRCLLVCRLVITHIETFYEWLGDVSYMGVKHINGA
jgi:hypothetical protein